MTPIEGVAERIRERLQVLGYWRHDRADVRRFCEARGYTPQYVYGWLRGRVPTLPYLNRLAADLGVTVEWLALGGEAAEGGGARPRDRVARATPEVTRAIEGPGERARAGRGRVVEHPLARVGLLVERLAKSEAELQSTISAWRDSEARFRKIFEDGPLGMGIFDPQSLRFLGVNARFAEMLGYTTGEITGRHVLDFTHPDEVEAAAVSLARAQSGALPFASREGRLLAKSGGVIWAQVTSMIVRNDAGAPLYGVKMIQDVTERKSAEERLQNLFARVPVGLYRSTPDARLLDANPAFRQIVGYEDLPTLAGFDASNFYVDLDERRRWQEALSESDVVRDYEKRFRRRDGTVIWVRDSARALRDGEGRLVGWEGALEDITTRKRAQEATEALARVGRGLVGTLDVARTAERIVNAVLDLLRVRRATLFQLDRAAGRFVCTAAAGAGDLREWIGRPMPADSGLMGLALRERAPVWTPDLLSDARFTLPDWIRKRTEIERYRSGLAIPLSVGAEVLGALGVGDAPGRVFSEEEIRLLSAFADQAALAFANARLYEDAERRRQVAQGLADVGRLMSESLDPREVGQRIVESVLGLLRAEAAGLYQLDAISGCLEALAVAGDWAAAPGWNVVLAPGTGVVGLAVRERRAIVTPDCLADPRVAYAPEIRMRLAALPYAAVLAVPLVVKETVVGALGLGDIAGRQFEEEEIRLAEAFANQAAVALGNARLFAQTEAQRDHLLERATGTGGAPL